jgi:hypothetical protein
MDAKAAPENKIAKYWSEREAETASGARIAPAELPHQVFF